MEIVVILGTMVGIFAVIAGLLAFAESSPKVAGWCLGVGASLFIVAWITNQALVTRNLPPVPDGGIVTTVTKTLDKGAVTYKLTLSTNSGSFTCADGAIKCADVDLGDLLVGEKWASDGWTWFFRPNGTAVR